MQARPAASSSILPTADGGTTSWRCDFDDEGDDDGADDGEPGEGGRVEVDLAEAFIAAVAAQPPEDATPFHSQNVVRPSDGSSEPPATSSRRM